MSSIVLLQDDPVVGACLSKAINAEPDLQVTGLFGSLALVRAHLSSKGADVLVADLRIGQERLVELLRELRDGVEPSRTLVLVIAMSTDDPRLMQALRFGADGYFIHGSPMKALPRAIRLVLEGESPLSPSIARRLQAHFKHPGGSARNLRSEAPLAPDLTDVERHVLDRASRGYLLHEIAREMHTSEHSVGLGTRSLYRKLQFDLRAGNLLRHAA